MFSRNKQVEQTLLACAVLVNLAGVMFESNRLQEEYFSTQRDAVRVCSYSVYGWRGCVCARARVCVYMAGVGVGAGVCVCVRACVCVYGW